MAKVRVNESILVFERVTLDVEGTAVYQRMISPPPKSGFCRLQRRSGLHLHWLFNGGRRNYMWSRRFFFLELCARPVDFHLCTGFGDICRVYCTIEAIAEVRRRGKRGKDAKIRPWASRQGLQTGGEDRNQGRSEKEKMGVGAQRAIERKDSRSEPII